jgi:hypothetical protein
MSHDETHRPRASALVSFSDNASADIARACKLAEMVLAASLLSGARPMVAVSLLCIFIMVIPLCGSR